MNDHDDDHRLEGPTVGQLIRWIIAAAIVVAIVAVALDNRDDVQLGYVVGDASAPLWIALVGAAVAGAIIAFLLRHRRHHRS